jgi:hypothetical protein
MNTKNTALAVRVLAATAVAALVSTAGAGIVYQQDFENPGSIGSEWSSGATDQAAAFTRFSQRRTNSALTLTLDTMDGQAYSMIFDLYLIDSWDGSNPTWGQDRFNVKVGSAVAFSELLDNQMNSPHSTFRNPDVVDYLAFGNRDADRDAIYRGLTIDFVANGETTVLSFYGSGLQGKNDESWGIDNLSVAAVPTPATATLLGGVALFATRRRRSAA